MRLPLVTLAIASAHSLAPHLRAKVAHSVAKGERRASERSARPRSLCGRCGRPEALCVCVALPDRPITTKTNVLILQHPNERRKKNFSTVPLMRLVLENVAVKVAYRFSEDDLPSDCTPLLLYPGDNALALDEHDSPDLSSMIDEVSTKCWLDSCDEKLLLILIDGTWTEAKRMARDSPSLLACCQKVQFTSSVDGCIYNAVRKEPEGHCLSTLEACAKALLYLEPSCTVDRAVQHLECVLQRHVDMHIANARLNAPRSAGKAQRKLYEKNKRRRQIELELFGKNGMTFPNKVEVLGTENNVVTYPLTLKDGAVLRRLTVEDASVVNSWWEYQSPKSLALVLRRIEMDGGSACLGVEKDGALVACIVRYEGGALGMLHCQEEYRRRGYGSALLKHATQALERRCEERVAFIVDGNSASEALFAAEGWVRENPNIKKGTGKRRAKRKWIHR